MSILGISTKLIQWFEHLYVAWESAYRRVECIAVSLVCDHYHRLSAETRHWTGWTLYGWARGTHWMTSWLHGLHVLLYWKNDFICPVKGVWFVRGTLNNLKWWQNNFKFTDTWWITWCTLRHMTLYNRKEYISCNLLHSYLCAKILSTHSVPML